MKTKAEIKEFVLKTLLPYKEDPSTCGYSEEGGCKYLTKEGKKCAVGKWMKKGPWQDYSFGACDILTEYTQEEVLLKPALEMNFSERVWANIQGYHDGIAFNCEYNTKKCLEVIEGLLEIDLPELRF